MKTHRRAPRRLVAPIAFGSAVAIVLTGLVAPAAVAAPVGDCVAGFTAGTQAEWLDGLDAAADCATADVTITLTDSFSLDADADLADPYFGTADLTLDGGGHTVTLAGASRFLHVPSATGGADQVHVHNVSLGGTGYNSLIFLSQVDVVTLSDVSLSGTGSQAVYVGYPTTLDMTDISVTNTTIQDAAIAVAGTGTITLADSTVTGATTVSSVGIMRLIGTSITVTDSVFTDNYAIGGGGALYLDANATTISGSRFVGNSGNGSGGAVAVSGNSLVIGPSADNPSFFGGNSTGGPGGAVSTNTTATTVTDTVFENNESTSSIGGAINAQGLSITGSTFTANTAQGPGGAVYAAGLDITDAVFTNNESTSSSGGAVSATNVTIVGSTFTGSTAYGTGGAVVSSSASITDSAFINNESAFSVGGAVYSGSISIADSTFQDNTANQPGGAVFSAATDVSGSTFSGNTTTGSNMPGGAIYAGGSTTVANSTFVNNASTYPGGAIYSGGTSLDVRHTTFSSNSATALGGAHLYAADTLTTYASVFHEGLGGGTTCSAGTSVVSEGYNFDDDGTCTDGFEGTGDIDGTGVDPHLGALADNQGPTMTMLPEDSSPLVDVVPGAACSLAITAHSDLGYDQRGVQRAQGAGCDIGAVEAVADLTFTINAASGPIEVTVSDALDYDCVTWDSAAGYSPTPPSGVSYPHGIFGYCFLLPAAGWSITITLDLPTPVNELWKITDGAWGEVTDVTINGTLVTYSVTDGGALDDDGAVDGEILDPVAPGIGASFTG